MIRILLLQQFNNVSKNMDIWKSASSENNWVVVSGRFNTLTTYLIDTKGKDNVFELIHENSELISKYNTKERFAYPIVIINNSIEDCKFWEQEEYPYIAVIKLHYNDNLNSESINISNFFNSEDVDFNYEETVKDNKTRKNSIAMAYHTTELSDCIIVLQSRNFNTLMKNAFSIAEKEDIGKTYTYFAINYELIKNKERIQNETIPMFSIQFSIDSGKTISDTIDFIRELMPNAIGEYIVNGIDDYAVVYKDIPLENIVDFYDNMLIADIPNEYGFLLTSTKKLGKPIEQKELSFVENHSTGEDLSKESNSKQEISDLSKIYEQLFNRFIDAKNTAKDNYDDKNPYVDYIIHSLSEFMTTLHRMNDVIELEDLVYLLIEPIYAFVETFNALVNNKLLNNNETLYKCTIFINELNTLMENVINTEGQLSHNQQMRPILFEMPIIILEYALAFLENTVSTLHSPDEDKNTSFLLVPKLCDRTESEELFHNFDNIPGVVVVRIPIQIMSRPNFMIRCLCHEVAHFAGDKVRLRMERKKYYIYTFTTLFQYSCMGFFDEDVFDVFEDSLKKLLEETDYIEEMWNKAYDYTCELIRENEKYSKFIRNVIDKKIKNGSKIEAIFPPINEDASIAKLLHLKSVSSMHNIFFKETFADICMVKLLKLDSDKYLQMFSDERMINNDAEDNSIVFTIRAVVCLKACNMIDKVQATDNLRKEILEINELIDDTITQGVAIDNDFIVGAPTDTIINLLNYSMQCSKYIDENIECDKIKKMDFDNFNTACFSNMKEYITKNRQKLIKIYSKKLGISEEKTPTSHD